MPSKQKTGNQIAAPFCLLAVIEYIDFVRESIISSGIKLNIVSYIILKIMFYIAKIRNL